MRYAVVVAVVAANLIGCGGGSDSSGKPTQSGSSGGTVVSNGVDLTAAGATFPYPIYAKWISEYAAKSGVKINYANLGSGAGIRQLIDQTIDFGATDAPMTEAEMAKAKGGQILHVPTVLGAVVIAYNLPGVTQPLNLTGSVIADIFLGKITKWNDPRITSLNPGVTLPSRDVLAVHRSDGSGTTYIFSDFLSEASPAWKSGPAQGKDLQWPVGLGGSGNPGVAGTVKQTPGSIGYVELAYARQNNLPAASIKNPAGVFVAPTVEAIAAAASNSVKALPANTDFRVSMVNAPGADAYPLASFTWLLVYKNQKDPVKGKKLVDFLHWATHDGQQFAPALDYAPLPPALVTRLDTLVAGIVVGAPK